MNRFRLITQIIWMQIIQKLFKLKKLSKLALIAANDAPA